MEHLKSKVVLITGASSGIGEALAREFAARGADLILVARRADKLHALQPELEKGGGRVLISVGDVTRDADLKGIVAEAGKAFGKIDIVVANAGFGVNGFVEELTLDDYRRHVRRFVAGARLAQRQRAASFPTGRHEPVRLASRRARAQLPRAARLDQNFAKRES